MSTDQDREKHSKRLHQDDVHIKKQLKIAKQHNMGMPYGNQDIDEPHRLSKRHAMDCGNPECHMCGNPRKIFKEKTIQEKKFEQTQKWVDE